MANKINPQGMVPYERCLRSRSYITNGIVYPGDILKLKSDGTVEVAAAGLAAVLGAALTYAPSGGTVQVADSPKQIFKIQSSTTNPDAQTDVNLNYDIVATAGSTTYKCSRHALDGAAGHTDATYPLKLLGIDPRADNALGANADCIVMINNHHLAGSTGTAGV